MWRPWWAKCGRGFGGLVESFWESVEGYEESETWLKDMFWSFNNFGNGQISIEDIQLVNVTLTLSMSWRAECSLVLSSTIRRKVARIPSNGQHSLIQGCISYKNRLPKLKYGGFEQSFRSPWPCFLQLHSSCY